MTALILIILMIIMMYDVKILQHIITDYFPETFQATDEICDTFNAHLFTEKLYQVGANDRVIRKNCCKYDYTFDFIDSSDSYKQFIYNSELGNKTAWTNCVDMAFKTFSMSALIQINVYFVAMLSMSLMVVLCCQLIPKN